MRIVVLILLATLLFGCSSTLKQSLSQAPIEIENYDLIKYWHPTQQKFTTDTGKLVTPNSEGFVKLKYLIDSNGQIFEPTIVESKPKGLWDKFALKALKNIRYVKSEFNEAGIPVYVTTEFQFGVSKTISKLTGLKTAGSFSTF
ncbi:MAG: energy transducer TonB [Colwellia sp.]|nr:energy transducer TonB [Colwellia sp.]